MMTMMMKQLFKENTKKHYTKRFLRRQHVTFIQTLQTKQTPQNATKKAEHRKNLRDIFEMQF